MAADFIVGAATFQAWNAASPTTTAVHQKGDIRETKNGRQLLYVQAGEALTPNKWCVVDVDGKAYLATKTLVDKFLPVMGSCAATVALNKWFWLIVESPHRDADSESWLDTAGAVVINTEVYTSGTAGKVDDVTTSQTKIKGLTAKATVGSATTSYDFTWYKGPSHTS